MDGVSIHDRIGLNDLLRALGSRAEHAWWRPKTVITYVSEGDQPIDALEMDRVGGPWTAGQALLRLHGELEQVIDGVLESVSGEPPDLGIGSQPWVILRAVDSSW